MLCSARPFLYASTAAKYSFAPWRSILRTRSTSALYAASSNGLSSSIGRTKRNSAAEICPGSPYVSLPVKIAFFTLIGASKLITFVFALFSHPVKLKLCSCPFSSITVRLPLITRPFGPEGRGTYSKRVDSIGLLNSTVNGFPKLFTP